MDIPSPRSDNWAARTPPRPDQPFGRDIGGQNNGDAGDQRGGLVEGILPAAGEDHGVPVLSQTDRHRPTDAAAGPRHEGDAGSQVRGQWIHRGVVSHAACQIDSQNTRAGNR